MGDHTKDLADRCFIANSFIAGWTVFYSGCKNTSEKAVVLVILLESASFHTAEQQAFPTLQ